MGVVVAALTDGQLRGAPQVVGCVLEDVCLSRISEFGWQRGCMWISGSRA
jgi:hypothetical protein